MLLFFILFSFSCKQTKNYKYSVDYYLDIYKADSLFEIKKYNESYNILKKLFKKNKPINLPPYYEYINYVKSGFLAKKFNSEELKKNVKKLIRTYGYDSISFKNDSILNLAFKNSKINNYKEYRAEYLSSLDFNLRYKLHELIELDQKYRINYFENDRFIKRKKIDDNNELFLKYLFGRNIYPNEHILGNHTVDGTRVPRTNILLLHTSDSIRLNYFLPKIKIFIREGKCTPSIYGNMMDQLYLYNNKEQIYGTYDVIKIKKEDYVKFNKMRKIIGLPSIEYELWKRKIIMKKHEL